MTSFHVWLMIRVKYRMQLRLNYGFFSRNYQIVFLHVQLQTFRQRRKTMKVMNIWWHAEKKERRMMLLLQSNNTALHSFNWNFIALFMWIIFSSRHLVLSLLKNNHSCIIASIISIETVMSSLSRPVDIKCWLCN